MGGAKIVNNETHIILFSSDIFTFFLNFLKKSVIFSEMGFWRSHLRAAPGVVAPPAPSLRHCRNVSQCIHSALEHIYL